MGTEQPTPLVYFRQLNQPGNSHLQHFASHGANHVFKALQNSYPTTIVQQMGGYRDDLEGRKRIRASGAKFQTSILLNLPQIS